MVRRPPPPAPGQHWGVTCKACLPVATTSGWADCDLRSTEHKPQPPTCHPRLPLKLLTFGVQLMGGTCCGSPRPWLAQGEGGTPR